MLFYASLFLFCVVLAGLTLWIYRSLAAVGKAVYRAFLPSSKGSVRKPIAAEHLSFNHARVPWGWSGRRAQRQFYSFEPEYETEPEPIVYTGPAPWGWPGNRYNQERRRVHEVKYPMFPQRVTDNSRDPLGEGRPGSGLHHRVGWPYRAEGFEFSGQQYRVEHAPSVGGKNIGGTVRPWGW